MACLFLLRPARYADMTPFRLVVEPDLFQTLIRRTRPPSTTSLAEEPVVSNVKGETQAENLGYTLPPVGTVHIYENRRILNVTLAP